MGHDQDAVRNLEPMERAGMELRVLRSCHSTWYFDPDRRRFQRVPHAVDLSPQVGWTPYHRLEIDPAGSFVVMLNDDDTRMLRSWVHAEPCPHCGLGEARTEELKLSPIRR